MHAGVGGVGGGDPTNPSHHTGGAHQALARAWTRWASPPLSPRQTPPQTPPPRRELKRLDSLALSPIFGHFSETLAGLATVRAFRRQRAFEAANAELLDASNRAYWPMQVGRSAGPCRWAVSSPPSCDRELPPNRSCRPHTRRTISSFLFGTAVVGSRAGRLVGTAAQHLGKVLHTIFPCRL